MSTVLTSFDVVHVGNQIQVNWMQREYFNSNWQALPLWRTREVSGASERQFKDFRHKKVFEFKKSKHNDYTKDLQSNNKHNDYSKRIAEELQTTALQN